METGAPGPGDTAFVGSVPEVYERLMVPMVFAEPASRTAATVDRWRAGREVDVLETAAGTGVVTRALDALGGLRIVATDLNETMLAAGQRGAHGEVRWQVADAQALPFDAESFDVVVCQFGMMFLPDKVIGCAEALRVLRPGGLFVFATWDRIEANEVSDVATRLLAEAAPGAGLDFLRRTPHGHHDVTVIEAWATAAGFADVAVERLGATSRTSADDAAVALCQGTPLRGEIARSPLTVEEATALVAVGLRERYGAGVFATPISWLQVTARRPADG